jgi:hypothetical protein
VDERAADLDRRFAATDPVAASEARRSLVVSPAGFHHCAGENVLGSLGVMSLLRLEDRQSHRRAVIESRNA